MRRTPLGDCDRVIHFLDAGEIDARLLLAGGRIPDDAGASGFGRRPIFRQSSD